MFPVMKMTFRFRQNREIPSAIGWGLPGAALVFGRGGDFAIVRARWNLAMRN